jgi:hypothetical protein
MSTIQARFEEGNRDRPLADTTLRLILDQHRELRRLLAMGLVQSVGVLDTHVCVHEPFRALVAVIRDVLLNHLADEETLLLPWLENSRPAGAFRAASLRGEHARQRAELDELCDWPDEASDLELAARFDRLARALLVDIAHEERALLASDYFLTVAKPLAGTEN